MIEKPFLLQMVDQTLHAVAKPGVTRAEAIVATGKECHWCVHNISGWCQPQLVDLVETVISESGEGIPTGQRNVSNVLVNDRMTDEGSWVPLPVDCPLVDRGNVFALPPPVVK